MAVTTVNTGQAGVANNNTVTVVMSGAPTAGNLLVAFHYGGGTNTATTVTAPAGWTEYESTGGLTGSTTTPLTIWWRVVQAGDGSSWAFGGTGSNTRHQVIVVELDSGNGAWTATPTDQKGNDALSTAGTTETVTATAANSQADVYAVAAFATLSLVGLSASTAFSGGFSNGGILQDRVIFGVKETAAVETSSTSVTWTSNSTARATLATFKVPAASATPATAAGAMTLAGSATGSAAATATGAVTLAGTATASGPVTATASGSLTLSGAATGKAAASATGAVTLAGTGTTTARATAAGTVTLGGTASFSVPWTGSTPWIASNAWPGPDSSSAAVTATGSISLGGSGLGSAVAAATGVIVIGGSGTAKAVATATGAIVLGGTTAGVAAAAATGTVTLGGTAHAVAVNVYNPHTYVYAPLASNGISTAPLLSNGISTAPLASNGASTAPVMTTT